MKCPTCQSPQWALYICPDGKHRCWSCKTSKPVQAQQPATVPAPTEHASVLAAKVALRNKLTRIESVSNWDRSAFNAGKHEGLSEALEILKGVGK